MSQRPPFLPVDWTKALAPPAAPPRAHTLPFADAERPDSEWLHPPSGALFLRGWERVQPIDTVRYDDDGADVSVRYGVIGSLTVSAYVFPLPKEATKAARDTVFFHSVRDMLNSLDRPRSGEECDVALAVSGFAPLRGRRVRAVGTPRGQHASTAVVVVEMFVRGAWAVKLRSTSTMRASDMTERFCEQWLLASRFGAHAH